MQAPETHYKDKTAFDFDHQLAEGGSVTFVVEMQMEDDDKDPTIIGFPILAAHIQEWGLELGDYPVDADDPTFDEDDEEDDDYEGLDDYEPQPAVVQFSFPVSRSILRALKVLSSQNYNPVTLTVNYHAPGPRDPSAPVLFSHRFTGTFKSPAEYGSTVMSDLPQVLLYTAYIYCESLSLHEIPS